MAGMHSDRGIRTHKLNVTGETPTLGLRVFTNDWKWAVIIKLDERNLEKENCGWYCEAWCTVEYEDGSGSALLNCDRMTTKKPN